MDNTPHTGPILFCTDFSANSEAAFGVALRAATLTSRPLCLLHVAPEADAQFWKGYVRDEAEANEAEAHEALRATLEQTYGPKIPEGTAVEYAVATGAAAQQIVEAALRKDASLIVLGRQGAGAVRALLFGNVAARVVRNAPCPVLVVPPVN